MKKIQILLGTFFAATHKSLSEQTDPQLLEDFEKEVGELNDDLTAKEAKIADLQKQVTDLGTTHTAAIDALNATHATALGEVTTRATAAETALAVFGATETERTAYVEEHDRLLGWYAKEKGDKEKKGDDAGSGANTETKATTLEERKAKVEALKKEFPHTFAKI